MRAPMVASTPPIPGATTPMTSPLVSILMGSRSDLDVMQAARDVLDSIAVPCDMRVISAHRNLDRLMEWIGEAEGKGVRVFIAGAGGAAHLPGVIAARTLLPVLGVPLPGMGLMGLDALLSIVQMPSGIPVGTFAIGKAGAANAGWMAAAILAGSDSGIASRLADSRKKRQKDALAGELP